MKWNTPRKVALAISLAILALALSLRLAGVERSILTPLHLISLAACLVAVFAREEPDA
jgi:hypothetical protein